MPMKPAPPVKNTVFDVLMMRFSQDRTGHRRPWARGARAAFRVSDVL
jgi:hypothetical protein